MVGNDRRVEWAPVLLPYQVGRDCLGTPRCIRDTAWYPTGAIAPYITGTVLMMTIRRIRPWDVAYPLDEVRPRRR